MSIEENPILKIQRFVFILEKHFDRELLENFDISFSQFRIMAMIEKCPGSSQKLIANMQDTTQAAVSRQIEALARHGLVALGTNSTNRKEHNLHLTHKGTVVFEGMIKHANRLLNHTQNTLNKRQKVEFAAISEALLEMVRKEYGIGAVY
ncbi:MAG: hypothetical protein A2741_01320 [Candidatus Zambryskibacteria bacterium RIFCSPHIGHO2_01_FULL_43_27]|uniref:HTH marR-type domain-containing protein n=1 Tax=Candidatus Zambryskibacteria bacterium RIFCSPLOWO2_01_FULL_43_17 TaxID=1802760 RepID=A0A1G2U4E1_9BACT|nr:MAG: hypothetical protein A2741_01320 [Candidatus Zambryskibacteria bacterium RIFCSPHIGHO2_01_FULL_43_27]OHA99918.1 MAG: hypothetical protein A3E93_00230 [Candidatus Zambryskibacteria bacterium RIFCSPHIGHO2_12_FULL_43_12b]OHB03682.1 MAG: hypothetical protein A2920_03175 [Candidatus Zambryskibacteria bacterium RIFCSPLOWO2_01_FULL_43_17]